MGRLARSLKQSVTKMCRAENIWGEKIWGARLVMGRLAPSLRRSASKNIWGEENMWRAPAHVAARPFSPSLSLKNYLGQKNMGARLRMGRLAPFSSRPDSLGWRQVKKKGRPPARVAARPFFFPLKNFLGLIILVVEGKGRRGGGRRSPAPSFLFTPRSFGGEEINIGARA